MESPGAENADELRERVRRLAIASLGGDVAAFEPIAAGLGTRVFLRVRLSGSSVSSAIARIEMPEDPGGRPPGVPAEPALEPLRGFLEAAGIPVPRCYAASGGIQLLEDLGDLSLEDAARTLAPDERRALYDEASGLVPRLQALTARPEEIPAFGRHLDAALFAYKADLFAQWALPLALGRDPKEPEKHVVRDAFAWIGEECRRGPQRLSHRDFKAANLHLITRPLGRVADAGAVPPPRRAEPQPGERRLVLIDLQGAFLAPPEYDLVCLFRDCHVALAEDEVQRHLERVRPTLPDAPDADTFARRFALLTLTRVGKDVARYLYAARTRDDTRYLPLVPRGVSLLQEAARLAAPWHVCLDRFAELVHQLPTGVPEKAPTDGKRQSPCGP